MKSVVRYLRKVAVQQAGETLSDEQLLETFLGARDEAAFECLLRRHGPMVLGVCRRALGNQQDAEDAFQATFLVLVRKAATIRPRAMVGNWLYGVAYRTARRAQAMNIRRRIKEREACPRVSSTDPCDSGQEELLRHLDTEINRLPEKYRTPVVLCELDGKSRKEASRILGLLEGTLSWRLARARKLLASRMARRGLVLSAAGLSLSLASTSAAALPLPLLHATTKVSIQVAAGHALAAAVVSDRVITLTEGVLKVMLLSKLKTYLIVPMVFTVIAGVSGLTYRAMGAGPGEPKEPVQARAESLELDALRAEIEGLRRSLQATRERVKSLESEMQNLKQIADTRMGAVMGMMDNLGTGIGGGGQFGVGGGQFGIGGGGQFGGAGIGGFGGGPRPPGSGFAKGGGTAGGLPRQVAGGGGGQSGPGGGPAAKDFKREGKSDSSRPHGLTKTFNVEGTVTIPSNDKKLKDQLAEAEKALKELRENPGSQSAISNLSRVVNQLKERSQVDLEIPKDAEKH